MKTEIYIEDFLLDQSSDLSSLLTLMIDDIKDFSTRTTTFSKTIILPGTANNNRLLGNIFQFGQANEYDPSQPNVGYNFNAAKSASCIIFQDNIQTFKGGLRLLEIDVDKGRYEYQVAVFGDMASLNVALGSALLEDLDFSAYDHVYNASNITGSWNNTPGSGYYYPLIDYGNYSVDKHNWDIRTFRPAFYVKEYIDKMFAAAGFIYQCDLFETDRFKSLVIPNNTKTLNKADTKLLTASRINEYTLLTPGYLEWESFSGSSFTASDSNTKFTYTGASAISGIFDFSIDGVQNANTSDFILSVKKNGVTVPGTSRTINGTVSPSPYTWEETVTLNLTTGDYIQFYYLATRPGDLSRVTTVKHAELTYNSNTIIVSPTDPGDLIDCNYILPKNIKQIDFLVSIVKLFNLYVYEDKFQKNKVYIIPYVDFYGHDNTESDDWTYKLNRNKAIKIKPMSELTSRIYNFKYASDNDYYNELYSKRYNQGYGSYIFNSNFEFTAEATDVKLIFAGTPLVGYIGEDKIQGTIFKLSGTTEDHVDSVIRIMQTKKITGVTSWTILDGATGISSQTSYGYGGHLDDPDAPTNDLNFGAPKELFFNLVTGFLSNNQFNIYWSPYMAEITDKDSKLVTGFFYLKPQDILDLDFSRYKYLDGVLFRLSKITDFNMSQPEDCEVSLLKVINTLY